MGIDPQGTHSREEMERFAEDTMVPWRTQYMLFLKTQAQEPCRTRSRDGGYPGALQTDPCLKSMPYFPPENDL